MKTWRIVAAATTTAALTAALFAASPAGAQEEPEPDFLPITVTPDTTKSGETVHVSGEDCIVNEHPGFIVVVAFSEDENDFSEPFFADGTVAEDGSWTAEIAPTATKTTTFGITAGCFEDGDIGDEEEPVIFYDVVDHEVTVEQTTPPTTEPPTTEPAPPTVTPVAPVANPVVAAPTFTG